MRIIGVESVAAPSMHASLQRGAIADTPVKVTLADGIAVKKVGKNTFPIIGKLVDEVVLVEEEEIAQAIVSLLERSKLLVEGAGAVTLAALLNGKVDADGEDGMPAFRWEYRCQDHLHRGGARSFSRRPLSEAEGGTG
nr:pyridoxal-phosphate dependent enzyme [Geotalea toluenoxydans]